MSANEKLKAQLEALVIEQEKARTRLTEAKIQRDRLLRQQAQQNQG